MELRVKAAESDDRLVVNDTRSPLADCFVAVRIGDHQKIGKYDPQRCYRFPSGCGRAARVDLFRRVGGCRVDVVRDQRSCDVPVTADDPSVDGLRLSIDVAVPQVNEAQQISTPTKSKAANTYLTLHGIEEMLHEAVTSLLREQPEDPRQFLVDCFTPDKVREPEVFDKMPSVASWQMPLPKRQATDHEVYVMPNDENALQTPFKHMPSVGSWCAKKPKVAWKTSFNEVIPKPIKPEQQYLDEARRLDQTVQINALRAQAQAKLATSMKQGGMGNIMGNLHAEGYNNFVKKKTKDALVLSLRTGVLAAAIAKLPPKVIPEVPVPPPVEIAVERNPDVLKQELEKREAQIALRHKAQDVFASSLKSGKVAEALGITEDRPKEDHATGGPSEANAALDGKTALKQKARAQLISGIKDGNLPHAVEGIKINKALGNSLK